MMNPFKLLGALGALIGLGASTPEPVLRITEADALRMGLIGRMRNGHSGSRDSKRQERARARSRRGKAMKQRQRRIARERGLSRSHP